MQYVPRSVCLNALLPVFALGLRFTPGCLLPLLIYTLVHAGVGVSEKLVHVNHVTLALAYAAVERNEKCSNYASFIICFDWMLWLISGL